METLSYKYNIVLAVLVTLVIQSVMPHSATAQNIPSSVEPGQLQKRLAEPKKLPKSEADYVLPKAIDTMADKTVEEVYFVLNNVNIEGNITVATKEIREAYMKHLGKHISLSDIHNIARRITAIYRKKGYLLSRAIVPEQRIKNGVVTIEVIEGYVSEVIFEGDRSVAENAAVKDFAKNVKDSVPLNIFNLEQYLLVLNDLPGVTAKSIFRPADRNIGAADLIVQLTTDKQEAFVSVDNRGTEYLGPIQISGGVKYNSLFGQNEQIYLRGIVTGDTDEMQYINLGYEHPLGSLKTKVRTSIAKTFTEPGEELALLNIEGDSLEYSLFVDHTWIRSRKQNLSSSVGLRYRNTETDILKEKFSEDRTRTLHLSTEYDFVDRTNAVTYLGFEMVRGFDTLDASDEADPLSRANGDAEFTRFNINTSRLQPVYKDISLFLSVAGQYSLDSLLASEEFDVGGANFGSAYDASEITGDHGATARLELQYGCVNQLYSIKHVQCYSYYDVGAVWNKANIANEDSRQTLSSVGVGSRFSMKKNVSGALELAIPLTRQVASEDNKDARLFFGLRYDF